MHIPDGILPLSVCVGGYVVAGATSWYSLKKIEEKEDPRLDIPKTALFTAAFFVASWIHIPLPPTSVHLTLIGLMGVVLGYYSFPAILIGLFFQAVMFQHGGLTTLGVNVTIMGIPALLAFYLFQLLQKLPKTNRTLTGVFAFVAGTGSILTAVLFQITLLITTIPAELDVAAEQAALYTMALAHIPLALIEGIITAMVVLFLLRVKPEALGDQIRPEILAESAA